MYTIKSGKLWQEVIQTLLLLPYVKHLSPRQQQPPQQQRVAVVAAPHNLIARLLTPTGTPPQSPALGNGLLYFVLGVEPAHLHPLVPVPVLEDVHNLRRVSARKPACFW